jgi:hypothetical protein
LVVQTFLPQDAELILATTMHTDLEDLMSWHYDMKGLFSVRSSYKVHKEDLRRNDEEEQHQLQMEI